MPRYDDDLQECTDDSESYDSQSDGDSQGSDGGKCGYGPWAEPEASETSEVGPLESIQLPQYNDDLQQCTEDVQSYGLQSYDDSQGSGGGLCGYGPYADPQVGSEGPELGPDDPACHPDGPNFLEKAVNWWFNTEPGGGLGENEPVPAHCFPPAPPEHTPPPLSWPWNEYGPGCVPLDGEPPKPLFEPEYNGPSIWPAPPSSGRHGEGGEQEESPHIEIPQYDPQRPGLPGGQNQYGTRFVPDGQRNFLPDGQPYVPLDIELVP
jgi:hypothetical protein